MKKVLLTVIFLSCAFFGSANTQAFGERLRGDGNELLEACSFALKENDIESPKSIFCIGFISGYVDSINMYEAVNKLNGSNNIICLPEAPYGQFIRVVHKYLKDHPEMLHRKESVLVFQAFQEAFPCSK